ncbi:MAG TPA: 1,4-alpha-glucan branching protein domain-containing protein [Gemmatimonadales bacterium]|jgi:1,4-alpha-glucan branching enzyme
MQFVLALHSHLPWVLHHGRWPHGSDWLCEAALDTYLPLLEMLTALERDGVPAPITLGITPVLANQLAHPSFADEMEHFVAERLRGAREAPADLARLGEKHLVPLAEGWHARIERLYDRFRRADGDLVRAFRRFEEADRLEIISSAATHGYLPLLARDESVRLQLAVGYAEHQRLFGRAPRGCWLPECAYRPAGAWASDRTRTRAGTDEHLAAVGFDYFFTDAHQAAAGTPLGTYHDVPLGAERFDAERHDADLVRPRTVSRSPYRAYDVTADGRRPVRAFVRDPRSSMQVWSRHHGYPGDEWYLEFHKIRWPGGLKLWRVTGPDTDLGDKRHYVPAAATGRAHEHARHFARLLESIARDQGAMGDVIVAPFDTELFGHWWFEGIDFLGECYRRLGDTPTVRARTASQHLQEHTTGQRLQLAEGSWGAGGDHRMWMNDQTRWTWERLWPLEHRFWDVAPAALASEAARPVLAQATRELLLAQSSDWQFIISTGAVTDYAEQRCGFHCAQAEALVTALERNTPEALGAAARLADDLRARDDLFPDVLAALAAVARDLSGATTP